MLPFLRRKPPIDDFWQWFKANRQRLQGETLVDETVFKQMGQQLRRIDRGLTYEILTGDKRELQISADGRPELIDLVEAIVSAAPKIDGWTILAFRQPKPEPIVIDVYDSVLSAENLFFTVDQQKDGLVDITVYVPGLTEENYRHLAHCAMMVMESVVGEYDLMTKIDQIEYEEASEKPDDASPIRNLGQQLNLR
jgi:hypothetical protein